MGPCGQERAVNWDEILRMSASLTAAAAVATLLSLHPSRLRRQKAEKDFDWDTVRSQILIAVAGALMVVVVGDSMARAFGLVGIGSFIRFRTSIRNPRDTAFLFLLIGLGMACGLELYLLTAVGTAFLMLLLCLVEMGRPDRTRIEEPVGSAEEGLF
jgi:hypothetical protein